MMPPRSFLISLALITIVVLVAFSILQTLDIPAGTLIDWVIGISSFWWLSAIVTIPWNMHYTARHILTEAAVAAEKGITINPAHVRYAGKLAKRFLWLAVLLHVCTAIALYLLAYFQITAIGYWASVATLLLTLFRPLQWAYEQLVYWLSTISQQIRYPRKDVYELSQRVSKMQSDLTWVLNQVATDREESWASKQEKAQARVSASLD